MSDFGVLTAPDTLTLERLLPGPIERVWRYLTDPVQRATWLAGGLIEPRIDGEVELLFHNDTLTGHDSDTPPAKYADQGKPCGFRGRVLAWAPPQVLAFTWGQSDGVASEVRFDLTEQGDQVHLRITHSRLPDEEQILSVSSGWHAHVGILADRLADRVPAPFWATHTRLETEYRRRLAIADVPTGTSA